MAHDFEFSEYTRADRLFAEHPLSSESDRAQLYSTGSTSPLCEIELRWCVSD